LKTHTVVKIDFCKSKIFSREREVDIPNIRTVALGKLIEISSQRFPYGDLKFPDGSYYKAEGDAVYFFLEKPTVAIRSTIEFMKDWYHEGLKHDFPECRAIIHRGILEKTDTPAGVDYLGKVFEEISAVEKSLDEGKIYVSEQVKQKADPTITKFVFFLERKVVGGEKLRLYYLAFSDPRTFEDDALAHLLFIAHKESAEMRDRILRFFIVQYILEVGPLEIMSEFEKWSKQKGYPVPPRSKIESLLNDQTMFLKEGDSKRSVFKISKEKSAEFLRAQEAYEEAVKEAVHTVSDQIKKTTGTDTSVEGFDVKTIMDEYLCGVFSEIRMIANYFRDTRSFYESNPASFSKYEYVIDRYLQDIDHLAARQWKNGFVEGLKILTEKESAYISTIFHNILAGYYLNRSFHTSPYQVEKLQKRQIYLDTNILYALRCGASNFHEKVKYFSDRLGAVGLKLKLYPFSVVEFETSLEKVENEYRINPTSASLLNWNPWLYQEFRRRPHVYLNDITTCRLTSSVTKGRTVNESNFDAIQDELDRNSVTLEMDYETFTEDEQEELWNELRTVILSRTGDMAEYWRYSEKLDKQQDAIIEHDVNLIENVKRRYSEQGKDDLGPIVLLITLDSKILKCRRDYPFIISAEQFLEFMMPYLFLSEIPESEPNKFPNEILSATLGVHTNYWKPDCTDVISMFFSDPDAFKDTCVLGPNISLVAENLSLNRLQETAQKSTTMPDAERNQLIESLAEKTAKEIVKKTEKTFDARKLSLLEETLEKITTEKEKYKAQSDKLRKTLKYYKRTRRK